MNTDTIVLNPAPAAPVSLTPPVPVVEERAHHPFSPSSLQSREACASYRNRGGNTVAAITGTKQHNVVETGEDDNSLDDDKALAAAECLDYHHRQKQILVESRDRENARRIQVAQATGATSYIPAPEVIEFKEIYLPVDDEVFNDVFGGVPHVTKSTTAGYVDRGLISWDRTFGILLDWKFGAWAVEHAKDNLQGIAYVLGLFKSVPTLMNIKFVFKLPHLDLLTEHTFSRNDIPALYLRVQTVVARAREAYYRVEKDDYSMATPLIPACNFCGLLGKCPKVAEIAIKVGQKFYPIEVPSDLTPTGIKSPEDSEKGLRLAQIVAAWAQAFKTQVTDRVLRDAGKNGELVVPPGFTLQRRRDRELVDTKKFRATTLKYLTEEELAPLAKYTFGTVEEAIKEKAPRGTKSTTIEVYQQDLIDTGAVKLGEEYQFLKGISKKTEK